MRSARAICYAAAMALFVAPPLHADEFNKLTYLTFSGPVQVPGAVLPAGTYTFKLADPETGRRVIQVWDKDSKNLIATLLTIPDRLMEANDDTVVLFNERPANEPQAVKAWFYPAERTGYEFVYPKDQAMKIAQANHTPVLSHSDTIAADADIATRSAATVGRLDDQGQFEESPHRDASAQPAAAPGSSGTADTTSARADNPQESAAAPAANAAQPSANRPEPPSANPSTTARSSSARAVGTSGQLPNTASPLPLAGLIAMMCLAAALSVRQLRKRAAVGR